MSGASDEDRIYKLEAERDEWLGRINALVKERDALIVERDALLEVLDNTIARLVKYKDTRP